MESQKDPVAEELDKRASALPLNLISLVLYAHILIDLIKAKIAVNRESTASTEDKDQDQG